ncbi:MAG: hypothetical protein R2867_36005 [Caldilineaceae bacterium]
MPNLPMHHRSNPNIVWLALFGLSVIVNIVGLLVPAPIWLRVVLLVCGVLTLIGGVVVAGWLQRSE